MLCRLCAARRPGYAARHAARRSGCALAASLPCVAYALLPLVRASTVSPTWVASSVSTAWSCSACVCGQDRPRPRLAEASLDGTACRLGVCCAAGGLQRRLWQARPPTFTAWLSTSAAAVAHTWVTRGRCRAGQRQPHVRGLRMPRGNRPMRRKQPGRPAWPAGLLPMQTGCWQNMMRWWPSARVWQIRGKAGDSAQAFCRSLEDSEGF